jgi:hypothetical protein
MRSMLCVPVRYCSDSATVTEIPDAFALDTRCREAEGEGIVSSKMLAVRCQMVCPRCDRAKIERYGESTRCAVCGLSYDPNEERSWPVEMSSILSAPQTSTPVAPRV